MSQPNVLLCSLWAENVAAGDVWIPSLIAIVKIVMFDCYTSC